MLWDVVGFVGQDVSMQFGKVRLLVPWVNI